MLHGNSKIRCLLLGGNATQEIISAVKSGFDELNINCIHIPTRKKGTRYKPIDNIFENISTVISSHQINICIWLMCKYDCESGLITKLKRQHNKVIFVFHSFDDPTQIDTIGKIWAKDFDYAITSCVDSIKEYHKIGVPALCLYPPYKIGFHENAKHDNKYECDVSFSINNFYKKELWPSTFIDRDIMAYELSKICSIDIYGELNSELENCSNKKIKKTIMDNQKGKKTWVEMRDIYASSKIVLNSHNNASSYGYVNERLIHAMASGGFMLVDHTNGLSDIFKVGIHLDTYINIDELINKTKYWLSNDAHRNHVRDAGQSYVLNNFSNITFNKRLLEFVGFEL